MATKIRHCTTCGEDKRTEDMATDPVSPWKRGEICNDCDRDERRAEYRARHYPSGLKDCGECGNFFTFAEFYDEPRKRDGLSTNCRECCRDNSGKNRPQSERAIRAAQVETTGEQECTGCERTMPVDRFRPRTGASTGYRRICRGCEADDRRRKRQAKKKAEESLRTGVAPCECCGDDTPLTDLVAVVNDYSGETEHECPLCFAENSE